MASEIGEAFDANVVGVLPQGLRLQLRGSLVVGWLPADALPDGPHNGPHNLNPATQELVSPARSYSVGVPLRVRVD